jgi:hypothetical protein
MRTKGVDLDLGHDAAQQDCGLRDQSAESSGESRSRNDERSTIDDDSPCLARM